MEPIYVREVRNYRYHANLNRLNTVRSSSSSSSSFVYNT